MSMTQNTDSDGRTDTEHTQDDFTYGDVVEDRERDTDSRPVVINLPPVAARDWDAYRTDDGAVTVAEDNPEYDPDAEVVVVMFAEDLDAWGGDWDGSAPLPLAEAPHDATYAFPPGRLRPVGRYPDDEDDSEAAGGAPADEDETATLREDLDAIADTVRELNVDDVVVDTFREAVVVEKLGTSYAIDADGTVDADDPLAQRLEDALAESAEVGE